MAHEPTIDELLTGVREWIKAEIMHHFKLRK